MALKLIHDSRLDSVATIRTEVEQNFDQIHFQVCLWVQGWLSPPATPPTLTTPLPSPPSSSTTSTWERPRWGRGLICRGETATLITSHNLDDHLVDHLDDQLGDHVVLSRMVETQRLESMRAAEARANSFLNPYSKGDQQNYHDDDECHDECHDD